MPLLKMKWHHLSLLDASLDILQLWHCIPEEILFHFITEINPAHKEILPGKETAS
jgi:hypothetical protein